MYIMLSEVIALLSPLAGASLAFALVLFARSTPPERERHIYGVGLVVAAAIYVGFAVAAGASNRWLAIEGAGVLIYGAAAYIGVRRWQAALAFGWAAHIAWDLLLHVNGPGSTFTPYWYPWLCVGFDIGLAIAVLGIRAPRTGDAGQLPVVGDG